MKCHYLTCHAKLAFYFPHAGMVNDILSWKPFVPLARLNYCVYLINLNYIAYYTAFSRTAYYYTFLGMFHYGFGMIFMVYVLALFTTISVEVPLLNLERLVFPRGKIDD